MARLNSPRRTGAAAPRRPRLLGVWSQNLGFWPAGEPETAYLDQPFARPDELQHLQEWWSSESDRLQKEIQAPLGEESR